MRKASEEWHTKLARQLEEERIIQEQWSIAIERSHAEDERRHTEEKRRLAASRQKQEHDAAENFIQKIMAICGESKGDVLKDVALITLEVIDSELQSQKTQNAAGKRKLVPKSPTRLPALVTELFAKLESSSESGENFRFGKKRKLN